MTANADTAVWLRAQEPGEPPIVVPGSHPWHVIIVHPPTGTNTEEAPQHWTDRLAYVCAPLHKGLQTPSFTSHTLQLASNTAESHTRTPPPQRSLDLHAHPPTRGSGSPQDHHPQPPSPCPHPKKSDAKKLHAMVATACARMGPPTTSQPIWPRPGPHSNCPRRRHHGPASWGTTPMGTIRHQRDSSTQQSSICTLQGTLHLSTPTRPRPPYPRCVGRPHPGAPGLGT